MARKQSCVRLTQLPPSLQALIRLMQRLNFGRVVLVTRGGGPDFAKRVHTVQTVKLDAADSGGRPESAMADFGLCREQMRLVRQMADLPDGTTLTIAVKHGLPFIIEIEQDHRA